MLLIIWIKLIKPEPFWKKEKEKKKSQSTENLYGVAL